MTGSHEQSSDKMGGNTANDFEEGELPEEGEIMDEEEEHQQQKEKSTPMEKEGGEESGRTTQHHAPFGNKTESGSKDTRGSGGGSSWRRSLNSRGSSEHNFGAGKQHLSRASGRYRDHDSRASLKSEEAMMDSWVRGTHRNKGARSPNSPHRTAADEAPCADQPKQKLQNTDTLEMSVTADDDQQQQKSNNSTEQERNAKMEQTEGENNTTNVTVTKEVQQKQPFPVEDDKDYRVETPPAKELPEESKTFGLAEPDDDNDFRRNSFGRFSEKRNFRANTSQLSSQNGGQQQMDIHCQPMNGPPHEGDDDYGPTPKRHRPAPFFDEENFPSGGGDEFRQHPHRFDQSFDQSHYDQHEGDFRDEHYWGGGRGRGGGFHHFRGGRGGMHRPDWGGGPRWSGGRGPDIGKPFFDRIICKFFREGFCRDGEKCTYSHATADSHRQPVLCRFYQQGFCRRNLFCQNLHGEWPCKAFHKGECTKEQCMFSHEPLDDVSRQILEKMLEDERRGITDGQNLEPQFQGGYYQRRKMFHQMREQQFHQNNHQQHGDQSQQYNEMATHNFQSPCPNHHFGAVHEVQNNDSTLSEFSGGTTHPSAQQQQHQSVQQQQTQPVPQPTLFGRGAHHQMAHAQHPTEPFGTSVVDCPSELPPPALVVPPILAGAVTQPQALAGGGLSQQPNAVAFPPHPPTTDSTSFGFFNRITTAPPPSNPPPHQMPNQSTMTPPQPNFQLLQQQAHQIPAGPHFPHQPSLLGPSAASTPSLSAMLQQQQQFAMPVKSESFSDVLQQISPTSTRPSPKREQSDTFNINQMLEQITQQSSEQFKTPTMEDPMDLLSKAVEESPASPPMFGSSSALDATGGADDAKLIPMVREWRLYPVDIPTETEGLPMNFDMKLIQQISSSNSDPRLRKLAEKQFDLVSKTFEKKQQSAIELEVGNIKKEILTTDATTKANGTESAALATTKKETGTADPRKDPRRKGRVADQQQQHPSTSSTICSPSAIVTLSTPFPTPFKMTPSSPNSVSASTDPFTSHNQQQVAAPLDNRNAEGSMRTNQQSQRQQFDGTTPKTYGRTEEVGQLADAQFQQPFASPVGCGGPFFGFNHHQQTSSPLVHQNMPSLDQSGSIGPPSQQPPFMAHLHPPPFAHQVHPPSSIGGGLFNVPPPVLPIPGGAMVTSSATTSLPQQLGSHAFNVGGFPSSSDSVGGLPRAQPSQFSSLREKRKNNQYESPLARIASSSAGGAGGSGRRGGRF